MEVAIAAGKALLRFCLLNCGRGRDRSIGGGGWWSQGVNSGSGWNGVPLYVIIILQFTITKIKPRQEVAGAAAVEGE